jgi:hypothetical protein
VKLHISSIKMLSKRNRLIQNKKRRDEYNLKLFGAVEIQNKSKCNIGFDISGAFLIINTERCPTSIDIPFVYIRNYLKANEAKQYQTYWIIYDNQIENVLEKNMSIELDPKVLRIIKE